MKQSEETNKLLAEAFGQILNVNNILKGHSFKKSYTALELFNLETENIPKLLEPFLQKSGLATLVGTSDAGKSTFLRQLCLSIVLKSKAFLGFKLNPKHHRVIYVTTEDDYSSVSYSIIKQVNSLKKKIKNLDVSNLSNLEFIFDTENLYENLKTSIEENPVDLIVIDAFTDIYDKEINANTQVRRFLNIYSNLAFQNNCLILFLHHIGKNTQRKTPSKDSIIGSQAFEAKMRVVLELRPNFKNKNFIDLWVLKSNFLESSYKEKGIILERDKNLYFSNTGQTTNNIKDQKKDNKELVEVVIKYHKEGLSYRKIEEKLKGTEFEISKTGIGNIIKQIKND
ncbi:AAA family ATPase [Litoribaculum gwangyangense]